MYTLLTKKGKIMQFYLFAVAELYQSIYGGVFLNEDVVSVQQDEISA